MQPEFARISGTLAEALDGYRGDLRSIREKMVAAGLIPPDATILAQGQAMLDRSVVSPKSEAHAEALGVLLGDILVATGPYQWLQVTDVHGTNAVVCHARKQMMIAPLSAVLKRFAHGEFPFDLAQFAASLSHGVLSRVDNTVADLPAELQISKT